MKAGLTTLHVKFNRGPGEDSYYEAGWRRRVVPLEVRATTSRRQLAAEGSRPDGGSGREGGRTPGAGPADTTTTTILSSPQPPLASSSSAAVVVLGANRSNAWGVRTGMVAALAMSGAGTRKDHYETQLSSYFRPPPPLPQAMESLQHAHGHAVGRPCTIPSRSLPHVTPSTHDASRLRPGPQRNPQSGQVTSAGALTWKLPWGRRELTTLAATTTTTTQPWTSSATAWDI
ncbi:hypothetical protein E2C01_066844 [Portunus trituberculatus]|uniref:Uncharacterized protein n=1 Tax=Portunus trituberculatus TaxID=210409 RepID=A0A5B7HVT0_PORTR|nr:hypothetical protein [Portunus trituberculatus]